MAIFAVIILSFTSCSDPLHDVDIDTPKPVLPTTDKIMVVEKTNCTWKADSAQVNAIDGNVLNMSRQKVHVASFDVTFETSGTRDSSAVYETTIAAQVSKFSAIGGVKDVNSICNKTYKMAENAFTIGEYVIPVSIADVKSDVVTFNGKEETFTFTVDAKLPKDQLCFSAITEGTLTLGSAVKVEGMDRTFKVPATITFKATDGEGLVYKYDLIVSESEKNQMTITGNYVSIDDNGNVSYVINVTNTIDVDKDVTLPGSQMVNATLTAEAIAELTSTTAGIALNGAASYPYLNAGAYTFKFNKFDGTANASYVNYIVVNYQGQEVKIMLPDATVRVLEVGQSSVIEDAASYTKYSASITYAMTVENHNIRKATIQVVEKIAKGGEEPTPTPGEDELHVVATDNGDNTAKIELVNQDNKVVKTWNNIPLGLAISVVRTREFTNDNTTLSLSSSKPGNWVSEGENYNSGNGVTAEKMNRTDVFTFSHFTENAVVSAYRNFKVTFDGKTYNVDFNNNVNSAVNVTKGDLTNNGNKTVQEWNNVYSASNGQSTVTANQIVKIGFEKQDKITGWDFSREDIVRQGNDLVRQIFGIERHSDSANDRETQVDRNVNLVISNNGTIKVYKDFSFNGNGSESSKTSPINEGDFVGSRATTVKSYAIADATAQVTVALDNVMSYKGNPLKTIVYSISSELNEISSTKEGIYKVTVYELDHTITVNGETFSSTQRIEKYILDMDYTIPGYEVDPDYAAKAARTKIFEGNRDNNYEVDCIIFRNINNHNDKKFVGFFVGSNKRVEFDNNFAAPSKEIISLVINASGNWEPADLYAQKGSLDASKDYLNGYKYKTILNGSDAYNTFSTTTMGGLEKYGNPLIAKMVKHDGYYKIVDKNYK